MALTLLGLKAWAAISTGSVSMLGSLADTALDLVASLVTLYAVSFAAQPADEDHRFGHGKAEAIAALMQTLLILASAAGIFGRAGLALAGGGRPIENPELGIGVSVAASVLTVGLIVWQRHVIRRTGSIAIGADMLHYQSDLVLNLTVIVALGLETWAHVHGADAVLGVAIAGWIAWSALQTARGALDMLMDREWPEDRRAELVEVVRQCPGVLGVHDVRTRSAGTVDFIQFHIWLPPEMSVAAAHAIVDGVEARVRQAFPAAEPMVHVDPHGHYDPGSQTAAAAAAEPAQTQQG